MSGRYEDIIGMAHHVSPTRRRMSMLDRAAQFSPFAALTGFDASIEEMRRLTEDRIDLDTDEVALLDGKLRRIAEMLENRPEISVTFFVPDERKSGGLYRSCTGWVKRIDSSRKELLLDDSTVIPFSCIYDLSGEIFDSPIA